MNSSQKIRRMVLLAMLCALAYVSVFFIRISIVPGAPYLEYEPKGIIITIGGLLFGPISALLVSAVVCLLEMITFSTTGWIGMVMNLISTVAFVLPATAIYRKKRTPMGAAVGLALGVVLMTLSMVLWNYLITPLYTTMPREAIAGMLIPIFLPFNLLKAVINAAAVLLVYKPIVTALRRAWVLPPMSAEAGQKRRSGFFWGTLLGLVLFITGILLALAWNGNL